MPGVGEQSLCYGSEQHKICFLTHDSSFEFRLRLISHATYFLGSMEAMSTKLPPNRFFTFKDGSPKGDLHEITLAMFTRPGTPERAVIDDDNSYAVLLDTESNGVISIKIDESRFRFTPAQATAFASALNELSRDEG